MGSANITFSESLDAGRSDQLLLCEAGPEWNASLRFRGKRSVVLDAANSGYGGALGRVLWVDLGLMLFCML